MACAKLTFVGLVILGIALGLFTAAVITGADIPLTTSATISSISEDAVYSAITTLGFVFFFNVRTRVVWACAIFGICGRTFRTILWLLHRAYKEDVWRQILRRLG